MEEEEEEEDGEEGVTIQHFLSALCVPCPPIYHAVEMQVPPSDSCGGSLIKTPVEARIIVILNRGAEVESHMLILT